MKGGRGGGGGKGDVPRTTEETMRVVGGGGGSGGQMTDESQLFPSSSQITINTFSLFRNKPMDTSVTYL